MNKKELITLAHKIEKIDKSLWRYTRSLLIALLTLGLTPIVVIHFCDAGNRAVERAIGIPLVIIAYFYTFYGKMPKKRWRYIMCVVFWLIFVFLITRMYHIWIHGPYSPWPSTMR